MEFQEEDEKKIEDVSDRSKNKVNLKFINFKNPYVVHKVNLEDEFDQLDDYEVVENDDCCNINQLSVINPTYTVTSKLVKVTYFFNPVSKDPQLTKFHPYVYRLYEDLYVNYIYKD